MSAWILKFWNGSGALHSKLTHDNCCCCDALSRIAKIPSLRGVLAAKTSYQAVLRSAFPRKWEQQKGFIMEFTRWQRFRVLIGIVGILGIGSLALIYFIPAPPSKVVMATAFKGASFEYYGRQYQEIFARSHVELELRETAEAVENLKLLQDPNSDVQIAFVTGGLSDAKDRISLTLL
jgi:TRAP-type uncharacterized transport system substrate-binding protein